MRDAEKNAWASLSGDLRTRQISPGELAEERTPSEMAWPSPIGGNGDGSGEVSHTRLQKRAGNSQPRRKIQLRSGIGWQRQRSLVSTEHGHRELYGRRSMYLGPLALLLMLPALPLPSWPGTSPPRPPRATSSGCPARATCRPPVPSSPVCRAARGGGVFINSFVNSRWAYYGLIIWGFPLPVAPAPETSPLRS